MPNPQDYTIDPALLLVMNQQVAKILGGKPQAARLSSPERILLGPQRLGTDGLWGPIQLEGGNYPSNSTFTVAIWPKDGRYSVPGLASFSGPNGANLGTINIGIPRSNTGVLPPGISNFAVTLSDGTNLIDQLDGQIQFTDPIPPAYQPSSILTVAGTEWVVVNRRTGWLNAVLPASMNPCSHYGNNLFIDMAIGDALDRMNYTRSDLYGVSDADLAQVSVSQRSVLETLTDYYTVCQLLGRFKEVDIQDQNFLTRFDELRTAMERERDRLWKFVRRYGQGSGLYETGEMWAGHGDGFLGRPIPPYDYHDLYRGYAGYGCPSLLRWRWLIAMPGNPGPYGC